MTDVTFNRENGSYAPPATAGADQGFGEGRPVPILTQYFRIAYRWKWLIIGSIAVALLLSLLITLLSTPLYRATTRIEISRESTRIVNVEDVEPESGSSDMEFYQTQYGLLRARSLAERVARELRLADNPDFFAFFGEDEEFERLGREPGNSAATRNLRLRAAVDILLEHVDITPMRLSKLVDVSFTSPDPQLSARIANSWASSFIESNLERRFEATAYARRFLEGRLEELRRRLEESERQLVGYASNQALINIPIAGPDASGRAQERSLTADSLAALNAELARATGDRVRAESRASQGGGAQPEALTNNAITELRARRAQAAAEYQQMLTQFEPEYPAAQALAAQVAALERAITREEARVQSSIQNVYRDSVEREQVLSQRVEGLKQDFLDQRRRSIQYNIFQRDVDTNRELYDGLLQRYKEIGVAGGVGTNNVSIVDSAQVPDRPSQPRPLMNLLIALLLGSVAGVALALVREQIDETITDPSDLEKRIGLPLLGAIPKTDGGEPLVELKDPKSSIIEAYLSVHTSLAFSSDHGVPRTLTVTSTRPAEGKSTTSYAIAYTIARNGAKTILVDGDMRSPSLHEDLGIVNDRGLSNYLSGTETLDRLIRRPEQEPFAVLLAGPQPPNAAELLRSDRLDALLAELLTKFDHVVIDSPPVMGLADSPIIASRTEGTVFVVEASGVRGRIARLALGRLRQGRARLLGTVLTKFESNRAHYGYGYDYGYGYGQDAKKTA
jgi:polysaccharide biosynthesis transport protein